MATSKSIQRRCKVWSPGCYVVARYPCQAWEKICQLQNVRKHRKVDMDIKLAALDWSILTLWKTPMKASNHWTTFFNQYLMTVFLQSRLECHQLRDPPYMTPLVKHLCRMRKKTSHMLSSVETNALQERINGLIRIIEDIETQSE